MSSTDLDEINTDAPVIAEPESTTPSQEKMKAWASIYQTFPAGRKDGAEFVECIYLAEEGGYAYRRNSTDPINNNEWRWMRTADFETAFQMFILMDLSQPTAAIHSLLAYGNKWKARYNAAYKAMGNKSRQRLAKTIMRDVKMIP